jgi:hypothetical protein
MPPLASLGVLLLAVLPVRTALSPPASAAGPCAVERDVLRSRRLAGLLGRAHRARLLPALSLTGEARRSTAGAQLFLLVQLGWALDRPAAPAAPAALAGDAIDQAPPARPPRALLGGGRTVGSDPLLARAAARLRAAQARALRQAGCGVP